MRREHGLTPGADNDFAVVDRKQFLATQQQTTQILGLPARRHRGREPAWSAASAS
ncbi:MAG: hypothetical protein MZV64_20890 [Ignavibacteriales bacterium]|nr:hypothetical protein [Ignavibacteriales bacterium]